MEQLRSPPPCGTAGIVSTPMTIWCLGRHGPRAALFVPAMPGFEGVLDDVACSPSSPFERVVAHLDSLDPLEGFFTRHYSPSSKGLDGVERRYFTVGNAGRIDAIRNQIDCWRAKLTEGEHALLLSTLVDATFEVSNTAGTYGCYLKAWKPKALRDLQLQARPLTRGSTAGHRVTCADAAVIASEVEADVLYADPPYTKRQYAAYYHVLETLVRNDNPPLTGTTGLRPWHTEASDWCYRRHARSALDALVTKSSAQRLVLSYNDDGQIPHADIVTILGEHGEVRFDELQVRRYRSSGLQHRARTSLNGSTCWTVDESTRRGHPV